MKTLFVGALLFFTQLSQAVTPEETKEVLSAHGYYGSRDGFMSSCGPLKRVADGSMKKFSFYDFREIACFTAYSRQLFSMVPGNEKSRLCDKDEAYKIPQSGTATGEWALSVIADFIREFEKTKPDYSFPWSVSEADTAFRLYVAARFGCPI